LRDNIVEQLQDLGNVRLGCFHVVGDHIHSGAA